MRLGLVGIDSSHAEDFLRHFNAEACHDDIRVTALWGPDAPPERLAELVALSPRISAASSLDVLLQSVDAVIVGDRHGDRHRPHALAAISAGKPLFIDKPLACSLEDATAIVEAADRAGTPILSGSALRWQAETVQLKARLAELDPALSINAYGTWYPDSAYGGPIFYAIHTIELMQELLGAGWTGLRLERGAEPVVHYETEKGHATLTFRPLGDGGSSTFGVTVASRERILVQPIPLPDDYMRPVTEQIALMLRSGHSSLDHGALLGPIRMMAEIEALLRRSD